MSDSTTQRGGRRPPFRADHVGSFLRPKRLLDAREQHKAGATSAAEIRAALGRVLYDQKFRTTTELEMAARAAAAGGSSAARAADAILRLAKAN